ncbi:hypothetical protein M885DRAFT_110908 [Pelagophyceae sp. CCMP2097]|nr:hypothetical protein M885DRAFT_110908 [Pelagophyceae sp. CCMP2097]
MCMRYAAVGQRAFLDGFFQHMNVKATESSMVVMQLQLGEDRLATLYATFLVDGSKKATTALVRCAYFYFDAETKLQKFAAQRRRWINTSSAVPVYILGTVLPRLLRDGAVSKSRIATCFFLNIAQLVELIAALARALTTGLIARGAYISLGEALFLPFEDCELYSKRLQLFFCLFYSMLTAAFVYVHVKQGPRPDDLTRIKQPFRVGDVVRGRCIKLRVAKMCAQLKGSRVRRDSKPVFKGSGPGQTRGYTSRPKHPANPTRGFRANPNPPLPRSLAPRDGSSRRALETAPRDGPSRRHRDGHSKRPGLLQGTLRGGLRGALKKALQVTAQRPCKWPRKRHCRGPSGGLFEGP